MSCFNPPFREPPEGRWICPSCPLVDAVDLNPEGFAPASSPQVPSPLPLVRESSVASSSQLHPPSSDIADIPEHAPTTDASEVEADHVEPTPRRSTRPRKVRKGKEVATLYEMEQDALMSTPIPTIKRLRIRVNSPPPQPTEGETQTIRLRVPARGKGKAREDPPCEEPDHGMFDDILSLEDRDVRETTISGHDHERYERSRGNAEVRASRQRGREYTY